HRNQQASVNGDEAKHLQNAHTYRRCCSLFRSTPSANREDFFNNHPCSRQLSGSRRKMHAKCLIPYPSSAARFLTTASSRNSVVVEWVSSIEPRIRNSADLWP